MDQLTIRWFNTSSGTPSGAEIKIESNGSDSVQEVPLAPGSDDLYLYTATGLTPNTEYKFYARCGDMFTWSQWSQAPLTVNTSQTNLANLVLIPPSGSSFPISLLGSAALSTTSDAWSCSGHIPASTPLGTYELAAELSGTIIASTSVMVVATLTPMLQLFDPTTNTVTTVVPGLGGDPFTIRGEGFPNGPVTVSLNGTVAGTPNAVGGQFVLSLRVPGTVSSNNQTVAIVATSGGVSASLSFSVVGQSK
jgi:hypothetical protein